MANPSIKTSRRVLLSQYLVSLRRTYVGTIAFCSFLVVLIIFNELGWTQHFPKVAFVFNSENRTPPDVLLFQFPQLHFHVLDLGADINITPLQFCVPAVHLSKLRHPFIKLILEPA